LVQVTLAGGSSCRVGQRLRLGTIFCTGRGMTPAPVVDPTRPIDRARWSVITAHTQTRGERNLGALEPRAGRGALGERAPPGRRGSL
jgi:hypothetical protein